MGKPADWVRIIMHRETEQWVRDLGPEQLDAFEISGHKWQRFPFKSYSNSSYPELDICEAAPQGAYDIIFAEQVWEHLKYPYRASKNVLQALRPGGWFLVTVPVLIRYHPHPLDCSRWTATGLHYFLEDCGFDPSTIKTGQWGNRDAMIANLDKWVRFEEGKHSLENEENIPVSAWALARKPL